MGYWLGLEVATGELRVLSVAGPAKVAVTEAAAIGFID